MIDLDHKALILFLFLFTPEGKVPDLGWQKDHCEQYMHAEMETDTATCDKGETSEQKQEVRNADPVPQK